MKGELVVWALAAGLLCACGSRPRTIVVGSKDCTEQVVLGEIVAQHLERRLGRRVERQLGLGPTQMVHQALLSGQVDVYPEYTGTALTNIFGRPPEYDPAVVFERVRQEFERQKLVLLPRLGFQAGMAVAISSEDARAGKLETLSDASDYQPGWNLGADHDFLQRPDGYSLLMKSYRLPVRSAPQSLNGAPLYRAVGEKRINMAVVSDTDGLLPAAGLKTLRDDRGAFPPYEAALVVRADALESHPGLREALLELSGKFSHSTVARLTQDVDAKGRAPAEVAAEFLRQAGLNR